MRQLFLSVLVFLLLPGCSSEQNGADQKRPDSQAQALVDKAIQAHGGKKYQNFKVTFDFRERHYTATRRQGQYTYTRAFTDSTGQVLDILNNKGFQRQVNGQPVPLTDEKKQAYTNSVNSVIYFALLPFGLNDPAVRKNYLGKVTIQNQPYHKINVSFAPEGGGVDHQDEFIYYFHQKTNHLDYFAYSYQTEGGGLRFRQAYNPRVVGGIRFQQYINYQPPSKQVPLAHLDSLFRQGQLEELSRIELENIHVTNL